jgi:UDP-glucuronate decarboxylase
VARIFNTYGPRMLPNDGRVVSNFIVQALKGEPITVYGDGSQTRSFCYVDDLIDGLIRLMAAPDEVTGPVSIGVPAIHRNFSSRRKSSPRPDQNRRSRSALPEDDPKQRRPDITVAKKALGWSPTIQLDEGLDRTIAYFRTQLPA